MTRGEAVLSKGHVLHVARMSLWHASRDQLVAGARWYPDAREWCRSNAEAYALPIESVAAVVAAASPRVQWPVNLKHAEAVLRGEGKPVGMMTTNYARATAALESGLVGDGPKVNAFRANLLGDMQPVTLDAWMLKMLGWPRPTFKPNQYVQLERQFQWVADVFGMAPAQLQATMWIIGRGRAT